MTYSSSEARDKSGKWTSGGASPSKKSGFVKKAGKVLAIGASTAHSWSSVGLDTLTYR